MYCEQNILAGKDLGQVNYYPVIKNRFVNLNASSLQHFNVGDIVIDVYCEQVYEVVKLLKWGIIRHLSSRVLSTCSLCDNHFELVSKPTQLKIIY